MSPLTFVFTGVQCVRNIILFSTFLAFRYLQKCQLNAHCTVHRQRAKVQRSHRFFFLKTKEKILANTFY